ncbi:L-fuculose-phosphate aldolase [Methanolinea mesophila]|uniref:aldolase n=1 Tax=Methanolinea mesophila TaxID=547055 RepID=UPI001AE77146|nr:aldolase [Methanolinea mesophila]MBP1929291.1 L-fuculose-phosphate aldolase [Methanolinea mesophila]
MHESEFARIGARLRSEGLVNANFGNISVRDVSGFFITSAGAYLDCPGKVVQVPFEGPVPADASSEYRAHREVYRATRHSALVHAHPPHAVAASLVTDEVVPRDSEGVMFCPVISVVEGKPGSDEIGRNVAEALRLANIVLVKGHGTFAAGRGLDEAYILTSLVEHSCRVLWQLGAFHQPRPESSPPPGD